MKALGILFIFIGIALFVLGIMAGWFADNVIIIVAVLFILAVFGGMLVAREKREELKLVGRVFEFPQAPIMVEIALKRYGSIIPRRMTETE